MGITDKLPVAILVFAVVLIAGVMIISDLDTNYSEFGVDMDVEQFDALNESGYTLQNEINKTTQGMTTDVFDITRNLIDFASLMFGGAFAALKAITNLPILVYNSIHDIAIKAGMDPIFLNIAFGSLSFLILMGIIFLVFRVKA